MTNDTYCEGDSGDIYFYCDGELVSTLTCKKPLKTGEKCDECFNDKPDTHLYCNHLRNKENPMYPQGCKLGNATSPEWCEKKERCHYFECQAVLKNDIHTD